VSFIVPEARVGRIDAREVSDGPDVADTSATTGDVNWVHRLARVSDRRVYREKKAKTRRLTRIA
jgi:hypothetical protein